MKKLFLLVIPYLFLYAGVDLSKEVIQVGVFKSKNGIRTIKNSLNKYDLLIKKYPNNLSKIFVVNIKKSEFIKTLKDVKKISPKAFKISKNKRLKLLGKNRPKDWLTTTLSDQNKTDKLDSKAIIKTRKKFFQ